VQGLECERNLRREAAGPAVHIVTFQQAQAASPFPQATDPASPSGLRRTQAAGPILMLRRRSNGGSWKAACAKIGYTEEDGTYESRHIR